MTVTREKVHKYLGITIDFSEKGKVNFTMYYYISDMLEDLNKNKNTGEGSTPAGDHLFATNEYNTENLSKEETITFHYVTAKLLYLAKRSRPDLQLGVGNLCTRVKYPDKYDWKNLTRVMKYI